MATYHVEFTQDNGDISTYVVKAYSRYRAIIKAVLDYGIRSYSNVSVKAKQA